jgi:hypothetical protein
MHSRPPRKLEFPETGSELLDAALQRLNDVRRIVSTTPRKVVYTMAILDEANLRAKFDVDGCYEFNLRLSTASGFTPPQKVKLLAKSSSVKVNLALGIHYFYTAVEKGEVSFGALLDFHARTVPNLTPHRFTGRSLSIEEEEANVLSNRFARFLGIGFMAEYVDATWFFPLPKHGRAVLHTRSGEVTLSRAKSKMRWPDYLAAPFNPERSHAKSLGAFYPLEFKGRTASIDFEDSQYRAWLDQSTNIAIRSVDGKPLRMKSWVLALNYRCIDRPAKHEASTFLIHDPQIGSDNAPLPASAGSIIRSHLARQCRKLGMASLSAFVESGVWPEGRRHWPQVYRIRHRDPGFKDRRYVGRFITWGLNGEPTAVPEDSLSFGLSPPIVLDGVFHGRFRGPRDWVECHVHIDSRRSGTFEVHVDSPGRTWTEDRVRSLLNAVLRGSMRRGVFIGQDAKMLRSCISTPLSDEPSGDEFEIPFEVSDLGAGDKADSQEGLPVGAVQVLRNGSVIANPGLLEPVEDEFWVR